MDKVMTMTVNDQASRPKLLWRLAGPPKFTAEDKAQTARNLNLMLPAAIVLLGFRALYAVVQQGFVSGYEVAVILLMLVVGGLWFVARRGYVLAAASALLLLTFIALVAIAALANKIFDGAFAGLVVVILMAGLLLDWKSAVVTVVLSIGASNTQPNQ